MNRRGFLGSLLGLAAAPVVAHLEPVLAVFSPAPEALVEVAPGVLMSYEAMRALAKARLAEWFADRLDAMTFEYLASVRSNSLAPQSLGGHT